MFIDLHSKCPACQKGIILDTSLTRTFKPQGRDIKINLTVGQCTHCGCRWQSFAQGESNKARMASRLPLYAKFPCSEDYQEFRRIYGLAPHVCARLFEIKPFQYIRYEQELDYPTEELALLFKNAFQSVLVTKILAYNAGVSIKLNG